MVATTTYLTLNHSMCTSFRALDFLAIGNRGCRCERKWKYLLPKAKSVVIKSIFRISGKMKYAEFAIMSFSYLFFYCITDLCQINNLNAK